MLAVIVVHVSAWPRADGGADEQVWDSLSLLARFCVPAFVVLSGLLVGYRPGGDAPGLTWLVRRGRRTLIPWLAWAPVFLVAGIFMLGTINRNAPAVANWVGGGAGHLYYLLLIPQLYLVSLLWPQGARAAVVAAVAALALQTALGIDRLYGPVGGSATRTLILWHGYELFPFWIGYFAVGVAVGRMLARGRLRLPATPFLLALPLTAAALLVVNVSTSRGQFAEGTGAFLRPLLPPLALAVSGAVFWGAPALLRRSRRLARAVGVLSRYSLGIYIVHPLVLAWIGPRLTVLTDRRLPVSMAGVAIDAAVALAGGLLLTRLLTATPLAPLVGDTRRPLRRAREPARWAKAA
ncbi:MAG: acyltransferase [Chloroflexi bacterium]|nr:MAG: acyltransferase [Chloroflexota bacterium]